MKISMRTWGIMAMFSFVPWFLVWIFTYVFLPDPNWTPLQLSLKMIGPIWMITSPFVTMIFLYEILYDYHHFSDRRS